MIQLDTMMNLGDNEIRVVVNWNVHVIANVMKSMEVWNTLLKQSKNCQND